MTGVIAAQVCGAESIFSTRGHRSRAPEPGSDRERALPGMRQRLLEAGRRRHRRREPRLPALRLPRLGLGLAVARPGPSGPAPLRLLSRRRPREPWLRARPATLPRAVIPAV